MSSYINGYSKIFENEEIIVLNKPSGLVVNRSRTTSGGTLQDYLIAEFNLPVPTNIHNPDNPEISESEFILRSGIVHRLDKDTSGALIIAKNEEIFTFIQHEFKKRRVYKEYLALTINKLPQARVIVDAPLQRNRKNRMKYAIDAEGRQAKTEFKLIKKFVLEAQNVSLVECYPETGRTHQIRVHLAALHTPIVGDVIYSGKRQLLWARKNGFTRLMLHSKKLGLRLSRFDTELTYFDAPLPPEFDQMVPSTEQL